MKTFLASVAGFYLGGVACLASYYAVWLAANPGLGPHWFTVKMILAWPWYRAVDLVAWCL
jgi:hypothetical protein